MWILTYLHFPDVIYHMLSLLLIMYSCESLDEANGDDTRLDVTVDQGPLRGFRDESLNGNKFFSFLGIPFAAPPIGNLRFKEPNEALPWRGVLEANKMPKPCLQHDFLQSDNPKIVTGHEDCLYLNVFTPQVTRRLPVMVFIYGGAFFSGGAQYYQPYNLLNEEIVLVVVQYRLGILGFLSTEDKTLPGNMGIKDQIMALKWVQKNIRNFGGDPDKVTIFGESAGGASTHLLMISPAATGLFHGVIAQSGSSLCPWVITRSHRRFALDVGSKFGCSLEHDSESFMKCMQDVDAESLLNYTGSTVKFALSPLYTSPRVDGDIIPQEPELLLKEGRYNKVNMISGVTRDEGGGLYALFATGMAKELKEDFKTVAPILLFVYEEEEEKLEEISRKLFDHYMGGTKIDLEKSASQIIKMFGDRYNYMGHDLATALHSKEEDISVYRYELVHRGQWSFFDTYNVSLATPVVVHGDDLIYLFSGGEFINFTLEDKDDQRVRTIMTKLWTNFARTGNPTPDDSLNFIWHKTTPKNFDHLEIKPHPSMAKDNRLHIRQFYSSLTTRQNQILYSDGNTNILLSRQLTGKEKEEL